MALKKSPQGLIKPYTREGVTRYMRKTAKETALMKSAMKELNQAKVRLKNRQLSEEDAEDAMTDVELMASQIEFSAKESLKDLKQALKKVEKYLAETSE